MTKRELLDRLSNLFLWSIITYDEESELPFDVIELQKIILEIDSRDTEIDEDTINRIRQKFPI